MSSLSTAPSNKPGQGTGLSRLSRHLCRPCPGWHIPAGATGSFPRGQNLSWIRKTLLDGRSCSCAPWALLSCIAAPTSIGAALLLQLPWALPSCTAALLHCCCCCSSVVVPTLVPQTWVVCPVLSPVPSPRSNSSISALNGHPFWECRCSAAPARGFNPGCSPPVHPAAQLGLSGSQKSLKKSFWCCWFPASLNVTWRVPALCTAPGASPTPGDAQLSQNCFSLPRIFHLSRCPLISQEASPAPPAPHLPLFAPKKCWFQLSLLSDVFLDPIK